MRAKYLHLPPPPVLFALTTALALALAAEAGVLDGVEVGVSFFLPIGLIFDGAVGARSLAEALRIAW